MNKERIIYVVTDSEAGWDCIRGSRYEREDAEDLIRSFGIPDDKIYDCQFIIHKIKLT